jgi:hypothetical protein
MQNGVSVVVPTVGRQALVELVKRLFHQDYTGEIQILIALDVDVFGNYAEIKRKIEEFARSYSGENPRFITYIELGYSTSAIHGGVHEARYAGSLRTALTFLAKYKYVAYVDDDDFPELDHISSLASIIDGNDWVFSLCNYADESGNILGKDLTESVGTAGRFLKNFGGFIRPSSLMLDKLKCLSILHLWSVPLNKIVGDGEDRKLFFELQKMKFASTNKYTMNYVMDPKDGMHPTRVIELVKQDPNNGTRTIIKRETLR